MARVYTVLQNLMVAARGAGKRSPGGSWVFRELNLNVPRGGAVSIIGPSGGGKSLLLRIIAGLIPPDEGAVEVGTREVGMLFQKNALFDSLTMLENLTFPMRERAGMSAREAEAEARSFLDAVGLAGGESLLPDQISGGMQKRLGIARALAVRPDLILYDEPTAGLDPVTSRKIADLILRLQRERGSTLITVTNDIHRAVQLGREVWLLAQGGLTRGGAGEEIWTTSAQENPALHQFIHGLRAGPLSAAPSPNGGPA